MTRIRHSRGGAASSQQERPPLCAEALERCMDVASYRPRGRAKPITEALEVVRVCWVGVAADRAGELAFCRSLRRHPGDGRRATSFRAENSANSGPPKRDQSFSRVGSLARGCAPALDRHRVCEVAVSQRMSQREARAAQAFYRVTWPDDRPTAPVRCLLVRIHQSFCRLAPVEKKLSPTPRREALPSSPKAHPRSRVRVPRCQTSGLLGGWLLVVP